jgi:DNA-directed RNA polymerase subunit RPC12/RpoP
MPKIPCFLCTQELGLRRDKHKKPYFVCDSCGMQIFVRGRQGMENLSQLIETIREHDFPFREHARILHEIQAVLTEIRGLEKELKALDSIFDALASAKHNKNKERARKSLDARIQTLLMRLERIAHSDAKSA